MKWFKKVLDFLRKIRKQRREAQELREEITETIKKKEGLKNVSSKNNNQTKKS